MITEIPLERIQPNPNQPRKDFDEAKLNELAASIREHGLIQPITVRAKGKKNFTIVVGERRFRAHHILETPTIRAEVVKLSDNELAEQALVENLQRVDITPLEEARAYQVMLDKGYTVDELAKRLGLKQPWRIEERTSLLKLKPEYLDLLAKKQITPSQAFEMSRLESRTQDQLFNLVKAGRCETYNALRASANGLQEVDRQPELFENLPKPTDEERQSLSRIERRIEWVCHILAGGFKDNDIVIVKKIAPGRAATMAQEICLIRGHLEQLEKALIHSAVQGEIPTASPKLKLVN